MPKNNDYCADAKQKMEEARTFYLFGKQQLQAFELWVGTFLFACCGFFISEQLDALSIFHIPMVYFIAYLFFGFFAHHHMSTSLFHASIASNAEFDFQNLKIDMEWETIVAINLTLSQKWVEWSKLFEYAKMASLTGVFISFIVCMVSYYSPISSDPVMTIWIMVAVWVLYGLHGKNFWIDILSIGTVVGLLYGIHWIGILYGETSINHLKTEL